MKAYERLLKYVQIETPSCEESESVPSSRCQFALADLLVEELRELGVDAERDEKCYVYGKIPATPGLEKEKCIGFIAHMDTVEDFADHKVKPIVHEHFNGKDIALGQSGRMLTRDMFGHLPVLTGRTLITSDGTTILGADDKAGIAEIMTMVERLLKNDLPHGPIAIGFTPDEEIGRGADHFDVERFGADFAFTVDGGAEGEIEYENFNAAGVTIRIAGINVHPGDAKDVMVNAASLACEFQSTLPSDESPEHTEDYEGFYHLIRMEGDVAGAVLRYIVRDHDADRFMQRKACMEEITRALNAKYGEGTVSMEWKEQYRNMAEVIEKYPMLMLNARMAVMRTGITPLVKPIRGGTDGARLSFMGLPCPNLGTGGYAFHGPYEHITAEGMECVVQILLNLIGIYSGAEDMSCDH